MSLLNIENDGKRSVLVVIYRLLLQQGPLNQDKLLKLCAPDSVVKSEKHVNGTLNTWVNLGLFEEKEGKISISSRIAKKERSEAFLSKHARSFVLATENNERFWEVEKSKSADFNRALSWLYAQDIYKAELLGWDKGVAQAQELIKDQIVGDDALLGRNDTRWNGLKHWVPYLGFGWTNKGTIYIDPTVAIRETLPSIFASKKTLDADSFMTALSERIPILDRGVYRKEVESRLLDGDGAKAWKSQPRGQLSTSLSRGLLGLSERGSGVLNFQQLSDADSRITLTGIGGKSLGGPYSHISYNQNQ